MFEPHPLLHGRRPDRAVGVDHVAQKAVVGGIRYAVGHILRMWYDIGSEALSIS
jgi:hypothetical protein